VSYENGQAFDGPKENTVPVGRRGGGLPPDYTKRRIAAVAAAVVVVIVLMMSFGGGGGSAVPATSTTPPQNTVPPTVTVVQEIATTTTTQPVTVKVRSSSTSSSGSGSKASSSSATLKCASQYTVVAGDYWSRIATKNHVTMAALLSANKATKTTVLLAGKKICLPGKSSATSSTTSITCASQYTVVAGDYWSRIATKNHVTMAALLSANKATKTTVLLAGKKICLPA